MVGGLLLYCFENCQSLDSTTLAVLLSLVGLLAYRDSPPKEMRNSTNLEMLPTLD